MLEWISRYWLEVLFGLIVAAVGAGYRHTYKRLQEQKKEQEAFRNGMKALLRDRIIESYNRCLEKGYCAIYSLENIHALYKEYKALGGNGAIAELVEKAEALPTNKPRDRRPDA